VDCRIKKILADADQKQRHLLIFLHFRDTAVGLIPFGRYVAIAALLLTCANHVLGQSPPVAQALASGVWLIPGDFVQKRQPDGNTVIFSGTEGLVVLDTGRHRWHREAILAFAKSQNTPIAAIVNSHWHLDHVSGNPALKAAYPQARVYASDAIDGALAGFLKDSAGKMNEYLKSPAVPAETAEDLRGDLATIEKGNGLRPDVVLRESGTLALAGRKIEVNLVSNGPTAGDVWLFDSTSRIAAVGDLVTLPVPFLDTACVAGWKSGLDQVRATPFETLIPGHGKPMTRTEFDQYRAAFDGLIDCSGSDQDKAICAAGWVKDAGSLLEANAMDPKRAAGMAAYYVDKVLRPNGGNSKYCQR
jgi:glyoxylase-like metal-dependent hydrolase (beta-lactamase superfamily II)